MRGEDLTEQPSDEAAVIAATHQEVKYLTSFIDGEIQVPEVRHHLHESWGLCARHAWIESVAECELRARPFGTSILYRDLTSRAADSLARRPVPVVTRLRRLRSHATCLTCDYLDIAKMTDHSLDAQVARVNARRRFTQLLRQSEHEWRAASCPACLGGHGPLCRPHLLAGGAEPGLEVPNALEELAQRLAVFVRSMTWLGPMATPTVKSSWIEAIGWFAGWDFPDTVAKRAF